MIVVWRVTEACNLACGFCAYDRRLARPRRHADPAAVACFLPVLAEYQVRRRDPVLLSWLGGEPLLWPPLRALSEQAHALGLQLSVTSNGTSLPDPAARAHLRACYRELTVSVDALDGAHDALRGSPGGFAALRDGVRALVRERQGAPLRLRVNVVLLRDTIAGFAALCHELASWGIDEITFNQVGGRDRPDTWPALRLRPEQVETFAAELPSLRRALASVGVRLCGGEPYLQRMRASAANQRIAVADCAPGRGFLFVDTRGVASPCSFTEGELGVPLAEVDSVAALCALPARLAAARGAGVAACADCHSTQVFGKFGA